MTTKAFYGRISDNPNVPAVDDQIRRGLESLAPGESFQRIFRDDNISAWSGKLRPGFVDLLASAQSGAFDTLVVVEWSRLFRDMEEQQIAQGQLIRAGVNVRTTGGLEVNLQTPEGVFMANMLGAQSQLESDLKRQRVRASVVRRLLAGQEIDHKAAFGWDIVKTSHGSGNGKKINPVQAQVVRHLHDVVLAGKPINSVVKYLNSQGIPTSGRGESWTGTSVRSLLRRTRNAGFTVVDGVEYQLDNVEPIVDRETYEAVIAVLDGNRVGRHEYGRGPAHMLTGRLANCYCGADVRHKVTRKANGREYRWYTCKAVGGHFHRDDEALERQVASAALVHLSMLAKQGILKHTEDLHLAALSVKRADIIRRRSVQQQLAEEEGTDIGAALARIRELTAELDEVETKLREHRASDALERVREMALSAAVDVRDGGILTYAPGEENERFWKWLKSEPLEDQRTLVRAVFRRIVMSRDEMAVEFVDTPTA